RTQRGPVGSPTLLNELGAACLEDLDNKKRLPFEQSIRLARWRKGDNPSVGPAVRVEGWREYTKVFGGLVGDAVTAYAVRGYFENGGQVAYVVRLLGKDPNTKEEAKAATGEWNVGIYRS